MSLYCGCKKVSILETAHKDLKNVKTQKANHNNQMLFPQPKDTGKRNPLIQNLRTVYNPPPLQEIVLHSKVSLAEAKDQAPLSPDYSTYWKSGTKLPLDVSQSTKAQTPNT